MPATPRRQEHPARDVPRSGDAPATVLPPTIAARLRRIELRARRRVTAALSGDYRSVFRGSGVEFAEAREYVPGDDVRRIDWNVTARMGVPWVKEYVEERELSLVCAVDVSASALVARPPEGRLGAAAEVTALLALLAAFNHDRAGLLTFTDHTERFIAPQRGTAHAAMLPREVLRPRTRGSLTDLAAACEYLRHVLRRRSVVFLVSDFIADGYAQALRTLAQRHEVIAIALEDTLDRALPNLGLVTFMDAEHGSTVLLDTADRRTRERYAAAAAQRIGARDAALAAAGVDLVRVAVDGDAIDPVLAYLRARAHELRRGVARHAPHALGAR